MADLQKNLTPSAIKYLLVLKELCTPEKGARCMDIAERLHVTKPSVHSMISNLCDAGLAERKKYTGGLRRGGAQPDDVHQRLQPAGLCL